MNNRRLIFLAILAGIVYWFADTIWDKFVGFPNIPFLSILLYDAPTHKFYFRPSGLVLIGICGILYSMFLKKMKDRESSYQQLLEDVNDAVFIKPSITFDDTEKYVEVNEVACEMLGYTKEEMLQLSPQAIIDPERLDDLLNLRETLKTEGHALFQTDLLKKDGSKIPVEINAHAFQFKGAPVCLALVRDISAALAAEKAFQDLEQQFRILAERLLEVQEEERGRLSKELHDDLGQNLMFLKMQVSSLQSRLPETLAHLRKECGKLLSHLDETAENVRRLCQDLNPQVLEKVGFSLALNFLIRESCELYGIKSLALDLDKIDDLLSATAQLNLYRIFQESLTNIGKHAQATEISVKVKKRDGQIFIRIQDNGKGYDPVQASSEMKGIGLSTLNERARLIGGQLIIQSRPGKGTEIILTIPLKSMATAGRMKWGNESISNSNG